MGHAARAAALEADWHTVVAAFATQLKRRVDAARVACDQSAFNISDSAGNASCRFPE
jgi:hypothetical protein